MTRVTFIVNGRFKTTFRLQEKILEAAGEGIKISVLLTKAPMDAVKFSEQVILDGANFVISVGGDGMLNEVVNGYMNAPENLRKHVALGVFSAGKGNDYVKSLGVSGKLKELFELIRSNQTRMVDIGLSTCVGFDGKESFRYFNNIADVGIGGYIVQHIDLSGTFINGFFTYQKAVFNTFFNYKHIKVRLESEELTWEGPVLALLMAKGKYFGSGLCIAPHAELDDGKIGLVLVGKVSMWDYLMNIGRIKRGKRIIHPEASYHTIGDCKVIPLEGECPIDMDGEYV
ncbi:MAG: hypothetical protein JKX73_09725, partial [Flavobacteriales bacterium]|nr:hypothetical protein [Flavobacteriales bacterium]